MPQQQLTPCFLLRVIPASLQVCARVCVRVCVSSSPKIVSPQFVDVFIPAAVCVSLCFLPSEYASCDSSGADLGTDGGRRSRGGVRCAGCSWVSGSSAERLLSSVAQPTSLPLQESGDEPGQEAQQSCAGACAGPHD